jgi:hypothetical protein
LRQPGASKGASEREVFRRIRGLDAEQNDIAAPHAASISVETFAPIRFRLNFNVSIK